MSNDNHEFTPESSPGEQADESTAEVRLAQPIESVHEHESAPGTEPEAEAEEWFQVAPFRAEGMRRLTLGTIGTGKTERIARHARHRANDAETAESIDLKRGGEENGG